MCKIDLPRKNMVIERERARRRREGRGKRGCWESTHTRTNHTCTEAHTLKRWKEYGGKSAGLGGMKKKKTFSLLLTSSPSH